MTTRRSSPLRLGVLISGSGSNLQAIIDAIEQNNLHAQVRIVISNKPDAYGLTRAQSHGLPIAIISHKDFTSREAFEAELLHTLTSYDVELVVLAGFMRLLSPFFIRAYRHRILNIHPALLPAFPGTHAQRQAVERGVRIAGATVHFVDEETDHGPIIIQAAVPAYANDTEETLSARILAQEHRIYPQAIQLFAEGRLEIQGHTVMIHDEDRAAQTSLCSPKIP